MNRTLFSTFSAKRRSSSRAYVQTYSDSDDEEINERPQQTNHFLTLAVASDSAAARTSVTSIASAASPQKRHRPSASILDNDQASTRQASEAVDLDFLAENFMESFNEEHGLVEKPRARTASDDPMREWVHNDREQFLDELLRLDGCSSHSTHGTCQLCGLHPAFYRCSDCMDGGLWCHECVVAQHSRGPLHGIEKWNGDFFESTSLKKLGLRIQLNHAPGERCFNPKRAFNDDFIIVDSHGIHEVGLDFCECERAPTPSQQLLRARLYPATGNDPKTAATFRCLKHFHLLSFESKCSAYEFYSCVERSTNNTGIQPKRDRYDEFLRMIRQWRHLKMLKRAGRGHDPDGVQATKPGQCALLCPACPQPDINLPPDWSLAPEDKMWLYALFVGIDANFRLKRKKVSSEERDPSLGNRWAFFVDEVPYKKYLTENWDQKQDRSTCVDHDAVNKPDREARGLAASGAGTIDCSRHDMKRPNGVGDLQLGERYINMDYIFWSSLRDTKVKVLVVSYDIVCQWHKNLYDRMSSFPHWMHKSGSVTSVIFLIPKFHLPAHIDACNILHSFNLTPGVGRTDGEAPERGWANINPVAQSTKEMGPGSRRDTLDDHFNDWNWKKIIGFGKRMLLKIQEVVPASVKHKLILEDFNASLPPHVLEAWKNMVEAWEKDEKATNPFRSTTHTVSEKSVRLQLAKVAEKDNAEHLIDNHSSHPSLMIANGLQLEDEQRRLAADTADLGQHPTPKQLSGLLNRSDQLRGKIAAWIEEQTLHMPPATHERAGNAHKPGPHGISSTKAYEIPLYLPSGLKTPAAVEKELREYEWQLREGQAYDALDDIRRILRLRAHLYKHKDQNVRGVKANTRSNTAIASATRRITQCAEKYRVARAALLKLATGLTLPNPRWERSLRVLEPTDIRGLSEGLHGDSEGRREPSWIWVTCGFTKEDMEDTNLELNEALRIEWCRTRARATRWSEETILLQEEMWRILAFLSWQAEWWECQSTSRISMDSATTEGFVAYAKRQASLRRALRDIFQNNWRHIPAWVELYKDNPEAEES